MMTFTCDGCGRRFRPTECAEHKCRSRPAIVRGDEPVLHDGRCTCSAGPQSLSHEPTCALHDNGVRIGVALSGRSPQ